MKVLVVTNMYPGRDENFTYKGIFVKEQVEALRSRGINVDVNVIDGHKGYIYYLLGSLVALWKYCFGRYDIVHCHYGLSALFTLLIPFMKWRKVVLTLHGGDILIEQGKSVQVYLTKKVLPRVSKVVVLNEEMLDTVRQYNKDVVTLVCGADSLLFNGEFGRDRKKVVLFPGRKDRAVKNYPFFENVLVEYRKLGGDIQEVILDGYERDEVAQLLKNSSLLLMTSISEGSPQVVKEAMLSDLAIISSDVGDVKNVTGGMPGTSIYNQGDSEKDVAALIDKVITESIAAPKARRERIFELGLDQDSVINRLLEIYRDAT